MKNDTNSICCSAMSAAHKTKCTIKSVAHQNISSIFFLMFANVQSRVHRQQVSKQQYQCKKISSCVAKNPKIAN